MHTGKLLIFQIIKINVLFGQLFTCLKNTMIYCPWSSGACDVDHGMDYGRMNVFVSGEISFWKQKQHASRHVISNHTTYRSLNQNLVHPLPHPFFFRLLKITVGILENSPHCQRCVSQKTPQSWILHY